MEVHQSIISIQGFIPHLSAYAELFGNFIFTKTPLAPPGTEIVFHNKPGHRASWAFHGQEGWYVGPAMDHYRNITAYFPDTNTEKTTDTVTFIPHDVKIPTIDMNDYLIQAVDDIINILKAPVNEITPTLQIGDSTVQELQF